MLGKLILWMCNAHCNNYCAARLLSHHLGLPFCLLDWWWNFQKKPDPAPGSAHWKKSLEKRNHSKYVFDPFMWQKHGQIHYLILSLSFVWKQFQMDWLTVLRAFGSRWNVGGKLSNTWRYPCSNNDKFMNTFLYFRTLCSSCIIGRAQMCEAPLGCNRQQLQG